MRITDSYVFFWNGYLSQWYGSPFYIDGKEFNCAEQWMMYNKAIMFNDVPSARLIMAAKSPKEQKACGRAVQGFDDDLWMKNDHAYNVVVVGSLAKFAQNPSLGQLLKETRGKVLVEASPYDTRWGIGMMENDPGVDDPSNWKGQNLLGLAITEARIKLFDE